jgi:hypothetical protein
MHGERNHTRINRALNCLNMPSNHNGLEIQQICQLTVNKKLTRIWPAVRYCHNMCLKDLSKQTLNSSWDSWFACWISNPRSLNTGRVTNRKLQIF